MDFQEIEIDAARICDGLRKIGYTPPTAITDIIDNSVQAEANSIWIRAIPIVASESRRENVRAYEIIDDGLGMNLEQMKEALKLGANDAHYAPNSLSKYGLGLKSAAFSQGEQLELISSDGSGDFRKLVVSLPEIRSRRKYGVVEHQLTTEDIQLTNEFMPQKRGTIVRIAHVRTQNHPSIKSTFKELNAKLGVIYYYMMTERGLRIYLIDIKESQNECIPYDVLFTEEANANGELDENDWDGLQTKWIQKPMEFTLDPAENVKATIEVTQLPYPPAFENQADTRSRYMIGAGNYGYYVYRNHRLLSWAESFGIIPQDQDFYSFRGRILIDNHADEVFNIDVKKSQLHPSEEAEQALNDISDKLKKKSKKAWNKATSDRARKLNSDALGRSNDIAVEISLPDELPGLIATAQDYEEFKQRQQQVEEKHKERAKRIARQNLANDPSSGGSVAVEINNLSDDQVRDAVLSGGAREADRIILALNTADNVLWEPFYFSGKECVRVNQLHRFSRLIYEDNRQNGNLTVLFNLLLLHMSSAEFYMQTKFRKYPQNQIEEILQEYRRVTTEFLAFLCREGGDLLPSE